MLIFSVEKMHAFKKESVFVYLLQNTPCRKKIKPCPRQHESWNREGERKLVVRLTIAELSITIFSQLEREAIKL